MTEPTKRLEQADHGEECSCKLLAQALGFNPRSITFDYCHRVLHKHWRMTCRHGQLSPSPSGTRLSEHWRDVGPLDPVKGILISNDQGE